MAETALQLDSRDNVLVALQPLAAGTGVRFGAASTSVTEDIPAKHKMALEDLAPGDVIRMYGMVVGEVTQPIPRGGLVSTRNVRHRAEAYSATRQPVSFTLPDAAPWTERTFMGYRRADGQVGTRNYWLVLPLVFCENRNVERMKEALEEELGYGSEGNSYRQHVRKLLQQKKAANSATASAKETSAARVFPNVDGIRFLTHQGGCGGTRQDAQALCGLLAGYIHHPNVAGATVLSLGCQNAEIRMLMDELRARDPQMTKPVLVFDQQKSGRDSTLMGSALDATFAALEEANSATRSAAPLSALTVGLKCGGSDGFSGISANPALGYLSDLLVQLGSKTLLSEFPELHGVEQELINRCVTDEVAQRFYDLMHAYSARAKAVHSGFDMNPSPGNIQDGLITDAIKSAGAARKGGVSPVRDVIDFPQYATTPGLNLLCTPGNDVECVTAQSGAGANLVLFTTGLGTPTGNPVAPVVKISTNSQLADRMADIIDFDAGGIITGEKTIAECASELLEFCIGVANGERLTKAEQLGQYDFIPWKRGVSL
ncbi:UxaA family hydrolase [Occallatibacter riparius]|uniref:Altronate dehydratase family protein n=1 Tax=Occallatibacter riparius TaxID=1002689 RepID=A0A9J7BSK6_9BACT|nr:altronate dehydratase family protein [Occallatibacter riparius]UWZ84013.1 altronate dehydratase family protein [Occallatibacter riparius]